MVALNFFIQERYTGYVGINHVIFLKLKTNSKSPSPIRQNHKG